MKNKHTLINILLILLAFISSYWAYLRLPERVASHWNAQGIVDNYSSRFMGAFFLPLLLLGIFILFKILPKIDPRKNISKFIGLYNSFITVFIIYMTYVHTLTLYYNLGHHFNFVRAILPSLAFLFYYIGYIMPSLKPNWFIGIRTPWTLSSNFVWEKTHLLGGKLYKASGIICLLG